MGGDVLIGDRSTCSEAAFLWICMRLIIAASADGNVDGMPQILGFTSMVSPKAVSFLTCMSDLTGIDVGADNFTC